MPVVITEAMYGPQFAKQFVNDFLRIDIPLRLNRYRNAWGVSSSELPDFEEIIGYEPLVLDRWPTIVTVAISTKKLTRSGHSATGDPEYFVNYGMRTYVWARADGPEATTIMRDRLTVVVRSALLDHPCLQRANPMRDAVIDESSVSEEYSELTLLKGDRFLAGAYISYDLRIEEPVMREPIAELEEIRFFINQKNLEESLLADSDVLAAVVTFP